VWEMPRIGGGGGGEYMSCHLEQKTLTPKIWGKMASKRLCVCVCVTRRELDFDELKLIPVI